MATAGSGHSHEDWCAPKVPLGGWCAICRVWVWGPRREVSHTLDEETAEEAVGCGCCQTSDHQPGGTMRDPRLMHSNCQEEGHKALGDGERFGPVLYDPTRPARPVLEHRP
jgi:hypothetical protein